MTRGIKYIIIGIAMVTAITGLFFGVLLQGMDIPDRDFSEGWDIEIDGVVTRDTTLSDYRFPHILNRGDEMTMTCTFPEDVDYRSAFNLLVYLTTVDVYLDGDSIYTYGHGRLDGGKMVGSGYHFVNVPEGAAGKELKIVMHVAEDNAFSSIPDMYIVPADLSMVAFVRDHISLLFVSIFLYVLGIVLMVGAIIGVIMQNGFRQVTWVGSFSFLVGTWAMCSSKVIQLFSSNLAANATLEYLTLYLAIVPLLLQMYYQMDTISRWRKTLLVLSVITVMGYTVVASYLHVTDKAHYCATLPIFHVIMGISVLVFIIAAVKPLDKMSISDRVMYIGFIFLLSLGLVDLTRFMVQKYLLTNFQYLSQSVLPVGTLIFIIFLIISYLIYTYSNIVEETGRKTLERMAYQDPLTGLSNRARCEEIFKRLSTGNREYLIVNMDLNGLKKTNDTYGHHMGDNLLKTFADNMRKSFGDRYSLIRMGGDEFVVVANEKDREDVELCLKRLEKFDEVSSLDYPFEVAAAWGLAVSSEVDTWDAEAVYKLADQRMYEMKVALKHER
ncbi:MAG: GGDEF domain-containing protein [Lachnospiraceae bacterium]|nr:GGDEF domain-containing protein [Lachnospiraceae bacterium]